MRPGRLLLGAAVATLLGACADSRREVARDYLAQHPPAGFELAGEPAAVTLTEKAGGEATATATLRLRLRAATVEPVDARKLPRGEAVDHRLSEIARWAQRELAPGDALQDDVLAAVAQWREGVALKRVVCAAGTEVDAPVSLTLRRGGSGWTVSAAHFDVVFPGRPDSDPRVPLVGSPDAERLWREWETRVAGLASRRDALLRARQERFEQALAALRTTLREGRAFAGTLADGTVLRVVVTRGLDGSQSAAVVATVKSVPRLSIRFAGNVIADPENTVEWRSAGATLFPAFPVDAAPDASLSLRTTPTGLRARLRAPDRPPAEIDLEPAGAVELIPEAAPVDP